MKSSGKKIKPEKKSKQEINQIEVKNMVGNTSCCKGEENQAQKGGGGGFT